MASSTWLEGVAGRIAVRGYCGVICGVPVSGEIISHAVWLYFRFALSLRDVSELMLARDVAVSHETIRQWTQKFGQDYATALRRRRPRPGDKWHMDEIFVKINNVGHYLWRAVEQDGLVLDVLVQRRRDAVAAKKFFRKLLKGLRYVPRVIVTDKLGSYQVAHRAMAASAEHRRSSISTIEPTTPTNPPEYGSGP
jgi:putative transposase